MSRGHVQGFDSNAGQFERMGNPWHGEPMTRKERRRARKGRRPCRPGLPRLVERSSREGDALEHYQCKQALAAKLGLAPRTIVSDEKSPTLAKFEIIKSARDTELTMSQRERGRWQRFEFRAKEAVAAAIYEDSDQCRAAKRRQLQRQIAALEDRLSVI